MNWFVWRIVTHERFSVTLDEIYERWSLSDLLDAHFVADAIDTADARAYAR